MLCRPFHQAMGPVQDTCKILDGPRLINLSIHPWHILQDCCGHVPKYEEGTKEILRETLYALRHMFHEAMGPLHDSRTGQDLLPMLLQGKAQRRHLLDFSGFHTAVLWLGPSIVAAGAALLTHLRLPGMFAAEVFA